MMLGRLHRKVDERGVIGLLSVLIYSAVLLSITTAMVVTSVGSHRVSQKRIDTTQTLYNAESGAEDALLQIKRNAAYGATSTTLTTTFDSDNRVETTVDPTGNCSPSRTITASGYVKTLVRRVQLNNCAVPSPVVSFAYALQTGTGGLSMDNNSQVNGSVYANSTINGANNAHVTGDAWVAGAPGESSPIHDPASTTDFSFGNASSRIDAAQSFVADTSVSNKLIKMSLKLRKVGNPGNATVRIVSDNSNNPSSTELAAGTLPASSVGTSTTTFVDVSMSNPPTLTNGTRYWVVIDVGSMNASNYWMWGSATGYAGGDGKYSAQWRSSGSMTWTDAATDFAFKVFMGGTPTAINNLNVGGNAKANTISNSNITGNAYYQTISGTSVGGTSYPNSPDPPAVDLPITDANANDFKAQAQSGTTYNGNLTISADTSLGPAVITGNLIIGGGVRVNMTGTIYVQGTLLIDNNAIINLDPGYGEGSGVFITDSVVTLDNNIAFTGDANSYIMMLTTSSADSAIIVSNNSTNIVLAAIHGGIEVQQNASANAIIANRLHLNENAVVNYITGLANVEFTNGPGASFQVRGWQEILQ